jgi:hypothetical protein
MTYGQRPLREMTSTWAGIAESAVRLRQRQCGCHRVKDVGRSQSTQPDHLRGHTWHDGNGLYSNHALLGKVGVESDDKTTDTNSSLTVNDGYQGEIPQRYKSGGTL